MVSNPSASVKYDALPAHLGTRSTGTATRMTIPSPYLTLAQIADLGRCWLLSCVSSCDGEICALSGRF